MTPVPAASRLLSPCRAALVFGLAVFLAVRLAFLLVPAVERFGPVQIDDSYGSTAMAVKLRDCPMDDCPAYRDLRQQWSLEYRDLNTMYIQARMMRSASLYEMGYSALILACKAVTATWEQAYVGVVAIGGLIMLGGFAYFVLTVAGPGGAGFALFLAAFPFFLRQGIDLVTPASVAMGLSLGLWAHILRRGRHAGALLLACVAVLMPLHPMGRAYAVCAIGLLVIVQGWPPRPRKLLVPAVALAMIAGWVALTKVVTTPLLAPPAHDVAWIGLLASVKANLRAIQHDVPEAMDKMGGLATLVGLSGLGLLALDGETRRRYALAAATIGGLLAVAIFFPTPFFPAELFERLWTMAAVLLLAGTGAAAWHWLAVLPGLPWRRLAGASFADRDRLLDPEGWRVALVAATGALVVYVTAITLLAGGFARWSTLTSQIRDDMVFERGQIAKLLALSAPGDRVLYEKNEMVLFYYMTEGAVARGAVWAPAVVGSDGNLRQWVRGEAGPRWQVALSPAWQPLQIGYFRMGGAPGERLEVTAGSPLALGELELLIENPGSKPGELVVGVAGAKDPLRLPVPARFRGWVKLPAGAPAAAAGLTLDFTGPGFLRLSGFRTGPQAELHWPWDKDIRFLQHSPEVGQNWTGRPVSFRSAELSGLCRVKRVVDDAASSVLAEVDCR